jgi:hypothetical protein
VVFFAHLSHADASYKEKKLQKKIIHPPAPHETHVAEEKKRLHDGARKKRERRENKKEEGRISPAMGLRDPPLGLSWFFFFFFPSSDLESPLGLSPKGSRCCSEPRQLVATHLAASQGLVAETHDWVSPAVGFFFSLPVGLIFVFFVFMMIKFQIRLTFPSRF